MMKGDQQAPVVMRILSVPLALVGVGLVLMPLLARRPDGLLAAHSDQLSLWVVLTLHPIAGAAMLVCAGCMWFRYSRGVLILFWCMVILALLAAPITAGYLMHYGK